MKHEIIDPLGLSVTRAAEVLGVTRATLSTLLNERAHLSPEMAVRIEKAFGVSMDTLMRMQNSYDIAQARERAGQINVAPFDAAVEPPRAAAVLMHALIGSAETGEPASGLRRCGPCLSSEKPNFRRIQCGSRWMRGVAEYLVHAAL